MRKLQRPPVGKPREKKQEPLAEGLQVVISTGPKGSRLWSKLTDKEIVEYATKLMKEKGICGKIDLCNEDQGLYNILHRRGLISKIGFDEKARAWREMSDEEIIELAMKVMKENNVTGKKELSRADRGVYEILRRRKLLAKINFTNKCKWEDRRSWSRMEDKDIVRFARKVIKEKKITGRSELAKADSGLYEALRERGLLDEVGFEEKYRSWNDMSDGKLVEFAKSIVKEKRITERNELQKADSGLYTILRKRGLLDHVFGQIEQQKTDNARQDVIDALTKFVNNEKPEVEVA
ncbi:MAG: hypothetical protein ABH983_01110 [Candidatus Micrarchaeota archaeon]